MTLADAFVAELKREAATTRSVLERVPEESLSWRPHPKSMSLGVLALHVAALPRGIAELLTPLVAEAPAGRSPQPTSREEILSTLDASIAMAADRIAEWGDEGLREQWQMTIGGETAMTFPRMAMVRSLMLNHAYHHRGQLTVYLRLLDVPLPPVYGPTADENPFG
jgi:uncharacterized damage-inducible protein DinB